jgi:hypothetical protein
METINGASIINDELVNPVSDETTLIIEQNRKLSEVLDRMPFGRIDKKIPGIGVTTLELNAERNSIIVEPTKSIAATKAFKFSSNALYVGSATDLFPSTTTNSDIIEFVENNEIRHKKFLVVADSLPKLMHALGSRANDFFIMVDEIDSFQSESSYRERLEMVLDYYFKFQPDRRCVVSATLMEFSNPELESEPLLSISYPEPTRRQITVLCTNDVNISAKNIILSICRSYPDDKVLVAYGSVEFTKEIIEYIDSESNVQCKVLCGENSKNIVEKYFAYLNRNGTLPGRVNFITSAYFTGVDINERFHLICLSNTRKPHTLLSAEKHYQIYGRGREGVLSEHFIHNFSAALEHTDLHDKRSLINSAENIKKAMECVELAFQNDPNALLLTDKLRDVIMDEGQIENAKLVRKDINGEYQVSYFIIDDYCQSSKTALEMYSNAVGVKNALEDRYDITYEHEIIEITEEEQQIQEDLAEESRQIKNRHIEEAIDRLRLIISESELKRLLIEGSGYHKMIYKQYEALEHHLHKEFILNKLIELNHDQRDDRRFKNFLRAVSFEALEDDFPFRQKILQAFEVDHIYNDVQIKQKLNEVYQDIHVQIRPLATPTQAIRHLKSYFRTRPLRGDDRIEGRPTHRIVGLNPENVTVRRRCRRLGHGVIW